MNKLVKYLMMLVVGQLLLNGCKSSDSSLKKEERTLETVLGDFKRTLPSSMTLTEFKNRGDASYILAPVSSIAEEEKIHSKFMRTVATRYSGGKLTFTTLRSFVMVDGKELSVIENKTFFGKTSVSEK